MARLIGADAKKYRFAALGTVLILIPAKRGIFGVRAD